MPAKLADIRPAGCETLPIPHRTLAPAAPEIPPPVTGKPNAIKGLKSRNPYQKPAAENVTP